MFFSLLYFDHEVSEKSFNDLLMDINNTIVLAITQIKNEEGIFKKKKKDEINQTHFNSHAAAKM